MPRKKIISVKPSEPKLEVVPQQAVVKAENLAQAADQTVAQAAVSCSTKVDQAEKACYEELKGLIERLSKSHNDFVEHYEEQRDWDAQHRIRSELKQIDRDLRVIELQLIDAVEVKKTSAFCSLMAQRDTLMCRYWMLLPLVDDYFESPKLNNSTLLNIIFGD